MRLAIVALLLASVSVSAQQDAAVTRALDYIKVNHERHLDKQVQIAEVAAPTFHEGERAKLMADEFRRIGLRDVEIDAAGNALGWRPGSSPDDVLVIAAHLDISFEPGVDVKVRKEGGRWFGPGLGDDSRGLVSLIAVAEALNDASISTQKTLLFVANTGEEGLGDLKGVKYLFQQSPHRSRLKAFISIDGSSIDRVVTSGTGVKRYKVTVRGPGGHSFTNFGRVSALHAMGRIVSEIAAIEVPASPKTTYNVGRIGGGTAVNAIAEEVWAEVDLRSDGPAQLAQLETALKTAVETGMALENRQRAASKSEVTALVEVIGNRPAGETPSTNPLVTAAINGYKAVGGNATPGSASTDSNLPMSLGIPAITVAGGGRGENAHSLNEWFEPANAWLGPQGVLLTILNYDRQR